ncbi:MAG: trimethylamine methyltransferase family protein [Caldilineaceae bacterium]
MSRSCGNVAVFGTVVAASARSTAYWTAACRFVRLQEQCARMRPSLQVLSATLIDQILAEAFGVLAEVGIEVRGPDLRARLLAAGLPLDDAGERVLFPRDVVEQALAAVPAEFTLYDRWDPVAVIGGERVHFHPRIQRPRDPRPSHRGKTARHDDFAEYARPGDGLEHIPAWPPPFPPTTTSTPWFRRGGSTSC